MYNFVSLVSSLKKANLLTLTYMGDNYYYLF